MLRTVARPTLILAIIAAAAIVPPLLDPFYLTMATFGGFYVTIAVAFDVVAGRVGALSLAQPVFVGFGAYAAGLLSTNYGAPVAAEVAVAAVGAVMLAMVIGIPSFRLSLHSFAIGTLGFGLIGQLIANNWTEVTRGTLCVTQIPAFSFGYPGGTFVATTLSAQYFVALGMALLSVGVVAGVARSPLGLAFTAVRDDPVLAAGRGLWPTRLRLTAFAISAALSALAGVFIAHFIRVVCPTQFGTATTLLLLIMVFLGGRASLRGVVAGAILFSVIPQLLRMTEQLRLVVFGVLLLAVVSYAPAGLEGLFARVERVLARWRARRTT